MTVVIVRRALTIMLVIALTTISLGTFAMPPAAVEAALRHAQSGPGATIVMANWATGQIPTVIFRCRSACRVCPAG